jgi:carboxypeptidase C (cathepsin A)
MELEAEIRENITMAYYEAGHMMYMHIPSLAQMKKDLMVFIDSAIPQQQGG